MKDAPILNLHKKRDLKVTYNSQSGNIFFMLFAAIALIGVLAAGIMYVMRGPLSTMVEVQRRTQAESEMRIASRLALLEATQLSGDGDCDADGFVEPLEWLSASGNGPDGVFGSDGGGFLPTEIGSNHKDPWGTLYGYCAWDAGGTIDSIGCDNNSDSNYNRLDGNANPTDETYTVIALISAGPDRLFQTTCTQGGSASATKGGDDILTTYTYSEAIAETGGLWNIKSGDPSVAEIDKNLEVTGGASFTGGIDLTGSTSALQLGAASMLFPSESVLTTCNAANDGLMRINTSTSPDSLEMCDDPVGWVSVALGATAVALWKQNPLDTDEIYYNADNVGIGLTNPNSTLDIAGTLNTSGAVTFGSTLGVTGSTSIGNNLAVTGTSSLGSTLFVAGEATLDAGLAVSNQATIGSNLFVGVATETPDLHATGIVDFDNTLNVDGASTLRSTLDIRGDISNNGTLAPSVKINDDFDVTGSVHFSADATIQESLTVNDSTDINDDLEADNITSNGTIEATSTITVNGDQLGPPLTCTSAQKLEWNTGTGWSCVTDLQGGSSGGVPALDDLTDVSAAAPADKDCLTYNNTSGNWESGNCSAVTGAGIFEIVSNVTRIKSSAGNYTLDDFVFGSPQLADDTDSNHDARFFFDKSKGAFRTGVVTGNYWDDASVGTYSFATGYNTKASGSSSFATGSGNTVDGNYSVAFGVDTNTTGAKSVSLGLATNSGTYPTLSADQSVAIFMGDQSGVNVSAAHVLALLGGRMIIDPDTTSAVNTNVSTGVQQLELDITGDVGATNFCDENGNNCFTASAISSSGLWTDLGGGRIHYGTTSATQVGVGTNNPQTTLDINGGVRVGATSGGTTPTFMALDDLSDTSVAAPSNGECLIYNSTSGYWEAATCYTPTSTALSDLVNATANNTTTNSTYLQTWNWALTNATADAFTYGETAAATGGSGDQSILKATTLASSTAVPLMVTNLGNGLSFRVNDATDDSDTTPFVIDASGQVGIGTTTPGNKLNVVGNILATSTVTNSYVMAQALSAGPGSSPSIRLQSVNDNYQEIRSSTASDVRIGNDTNGTTFVITGTAGYANINGSPATAGLIGINTNVPQKDLSFGGNSARTIWVERHATTDGSNLNLQAGGAAPQIADKNGGNLVISSGISTGNGYSSIIFQTVLPSQGAGTTDRNPTTAMTLATNALTIPSGPTTQQPGQTGMQSSVNGMIRYDTTVGKFQAYQAGAWQDILTSASGNQTSLSSITAATNNNSIANAGYLQTWNWYVRNPGDDAFSFGETTAAINGVGDQSILKTSTLASSTAIPLVITNLGNAHSFRVNDATSDLDITPFVIDASGNVGIGTETATEKLEISGNIDVSNNIYVGGGHAGGYGVGDGTDNARIYFPAQNSDASWITGTYSGSATNMTIAVGDDPNDSIYIHTSPAGGLPVNAGTVVLQRYGGSVGIGTLTPQATLDITGTDAVLLTRGTTAQQPSSPVNGMIRYNSTNNKFEAYENGAWSNMITSSSASNLGLFENVSNVVRAKSAAVNYATDDFVFGSPQLADDGDTNHDSRLWFDKSKSAFRVGITTDAQWDDSNVGLESFASGYDTTASGQRSFVHGYNSTASNTYSVALGSGITSSGQNSMAWGNSTVASGQYAISGGAATTSSGASSISFGEDTIASGDNSIAFGLGDIAGTGTSRPEVSGTSSIGIFMGDQTNYELTTNNRMALVGGDFLLDDAGATGSQGCIRYNGTSSKLEYSHDCTTFSDFGGSASSVALSSITAATANNTILNGTYNQVWGWQLTGSEIGLLYSDSAASTGSLNALVAMQSVPSSLTVPLALYNEGDTLSFYAADEANDSTPFIIDENGNVGVGTTSIIGKVYVNFDNPVILGFSNGGNNYGLVSSAYEVGTGQSYAVTATTTSNPSTDVTALYASVGNGQGRGILLDSGTITSGTLMEINHVGSAFSGNMIEANMAAGSGSFTGNFFQFQNNNDQKFYVDSTGEIGASNYCDEDGNNCFSASSISPVFQVTGSAGSELVSTVNANTPYASSDFVFGSSQLADTGSVANDSRMFFDKSKGAFRAGMVQGTQWDDANVGNYSTAFGFNTRATGASSFAIGESSWATAPYSIAGGQLTQTAGDHSTVFGREISISAAGDSSVGYGLTTTSPATDPIISGAQSFGIFMGNHTGVDFAATNTMGLFGGQLVIDPTIPATQLTARGVIDVGAATNAIVIPNGTTGQRPGTGVNGMIRYNASNNKFEAYENGNWTNMIGGLATAAGSDREIQFNNSGALGASSNLTYSSSGNLQMNLSDGLNDALIFANSAGTAQYSLKVKPDWPGQLSIYAPYGGEMLRLVESGAGFSEMRLNVGETPAGVDTDQLLRLTAADGIFFGHANPNTTNPAKFTFRNTSGAITIGVLEAYGINGDIDSKIELKAANDGLPVEDQFVLTNTGAIGLLTDSPQTTLDINSTEAILLPRGTTAERPGTGVNGMIRYNSTNNKFEAYENGSWTNIIGGAGSIEINDLTDSMTDYVTDFNMTIGHEGSSITATSGQYNLAIGRLSGDSITTGDRNVAIGYEAMTAITTGSSNTAFGYHAFNSAVSVNEGTAVGFEAMERAYGSSNTALGVRALRGSTTPTNNTGTGNVAVGDSALESFTTGTNNVAVGVTTLSSLTTGVGNVAIGPSALISTSTGGDNIAIGSVAAYDNTTGGGNIAIGLYALNSNTSSNQNTAIGHFAMRYANDDASFASWQSTYNTAIGYEALRGSPTPSDNTGINNTAVGHSALLNNSSGLRNSALGSGALGNNTTGNYNTAMGYNTLANISTGESNVGIGHLALDGGDGTASYNIAIGPNTLRVNNGNDNVALGMGALHDNTDGNQNTALGNYAGDNITTGNTNIIIGYNIDAPNATGSNQLNIGDSIYGDLSTDQIAIGTATQTTGAQFKVAGTNSIIIPIGTDAQRPATGAAGMMRYNTTATPNDKLEYYDAESAAWIQLSSGTGSTSALNDLTDGTTDYVTDKNIFLGANAGTNIATGGQYNLTLGENTGASITTGDENVGIGYNALSNLVISNNNTAVGSFALQDVTGTDNTAIGRQAMGQATTSQYNVAVGSNAMTYGNPGQSNTIIGANSGATSPGSWNVAIGSNSLYSGAGDNNIAIGAGSLNATTSGNNTAIGTNTLFSNVAKSESTAIGYQSMYYADDTTTGAITYNTAVGAYSLQGSSTAADNNGVSNTAIGHSALLGNTSGSYNVAVGSNASADNQGGFGNTAIGNWALRYSNASKNTAIGWDAMQSNRDGEDNVAIGVLSMYSNEALTQGVAIGNEAMRYANNTSTSAISYNTAVGFQALRGSTTPTDNTGTSNTAIGHSALLSTTSGSDNAALGTFALFQNTTGQRNVAIGVDALTSNTTSEANTAVGFQSLNSNNGGDQNVAVGASSLGSNITGGSNTAVGYYTLQANTGGITNTAVGAGALTASTGNDNTALGWGAGDNLTSGNNNIIVGSNIDFANATGSNQLNIGDSIYGDLSTDQIAIGTATQTTGAQFKIAGTNSIIIPIGTDAQRPATGAAGMMRYNTTATPNDKLEYYDAESAAWIQLSSGTGSTSALNDLTDAVTDYTTDHNMRIGSDTAMFSGAVNNLFIGENAGTAGTTNAADNNIAFGYQSLDALTTGNSNLAIGTSTLGANTTGYRNVAIGTGVMQSTVARRENTAVGYNAMYYADSSSSGAISYNTALGAYALRGSSTPSANTGIKNTAIGHSSLISNTTGNRNTALGSFSMESNTTGDQNTALGEYALGSNTSGGDNVAIGIDALSFNDTGNSNVSIGNFSLSANTAGNYNVAIGYSSSFGSTGSGNVAIGNGAIHSSNNASDNTAIGTSSLYDVIGGGNSAFGSGTGSKITSGTNNTVLGQSVASTTLTTGSNNILIGNSSAVDTPAAGTNNHLNIGNTIYGDLSTDQIAIGTATQTTGAQFKVAGTNSIIIPIGTDAQRPATGAAGMMRYNTTATPNDKLEYYDAESAAWIQLSSGTGSTSALNDLTDGTTDYVTDNNLFIGLDAGADMAGGQGNLFIGQNTGTNVTSGSRNVLIGLDAGNTITTGGFNTIIGWEAQTGSGNPDSVVTIGMQAYSFPYGSAIGTYAVAPTDGVSVGSSAGFNTTTGSTNVNIGSHAGFHTTTGDNNTALGGYALYSNVENEENTAVGYYSMYYADDTTTGAITYNTAVGAYSLQGSTTASDNTGISNTAIGHSALLANTSGSRNVGVGRQTLLNSTTGDNNVAIGAFSLLANTEGYNNTSLGEEALASNTTGSANTAVGRFALNNNTTGSLNTSLGHNTGATLDSGSNNILIGNNADVPTANTSNYLNIGSSIYGDLSTDFIGIGNATPTVALDVTGDIEYSGTLTDVSDIRLKTDIVPLNQNKDILNKISKINTYSFRMKDNKMGQTEYGVIAQELEKIFPDLVRTAPDKMGTKSVNYVGLIAPLIETTKELKLQNESLKAEINSLHQEQIKLVTSYEKLSKQIEFLNTLANNRVNKASSNDFFIMLIIFIGGIGTLVLINQRQKKY